MAGQPIELKVTSEVSNSFLSLSDEVEEALVYGLTGFGGLLVIVLFFRSRAENRMIREALEEEDES